MPPETGHLQAVGKRQVAISRDTNRVRTWLKFQRAEGSLPDFCVIDCYDRIGD